MSKKGAATVRVPCAGLVAARAPHACVSQSTRRAARTRTKHLCLHTRHLSSTLLARAQAARTVSGMIRLTVPAGKAAPAPPVGPALGQKGVNIMEFCKAFNADTQGVEPGLPIPVVITVYSDKSFTYIKKTPPASILLQKIAGIKSGSGRPNTEKVGKVTRAQLEEVANQKWPDLTAADMDAAVRTIAGSARSAGIETEGVN